MKKINLLMLIFFTICIKLSAQYTFIPSTKEEEDFLASTKKSASQEFPQMYNKTTRFLYEYDFAAPDPVTFSGIKYGKIDTNRICRPIYGKNMLVLFKNYHPYRDSISLGISYNDKFLENAGTFTTAFNGTIGQKTDITGDAEDQEKTALTSEQYLQLFEKLNSELKTYYERKLNESTVNIAVVQYGISFINSNMKKKLKIKDFSSKGITDKAADIISTISMDNTNAAKILEQARTASYYYGKIINYKTFDAHSIQIQNKDEIQLEINQYRNGVKVTALEESKKVFNIRGGFKADFSLGLFGTGLIDKGYTTVSVTHADTVFFTASNGVVDRDSILSIADSELAAKKDSIIKENTGTFNIGPAVLAHFYYRTGLSVNLALTVGFSLNLQATPRYLTGLSVLLGRDSRFILSGGVAFGQYKDLASGLSEGQRIKLSSYANSTLPTKDVWGTSWFFSLSWNFAGVTLGK